MELVRSGDRTAFDTLFQRHQGPVWRFLWRKTRDREASSELFQEVFLRVWRAASTFQTGQKFRPWLYRVATNLAHDRYRSGRREVEVVDVDLKLTASPLRQPIESIDLRRAIEGLPDSYRDAFVLGVVQGLDHREVAEALEITPQNARARISRARGRLRQVLLEGGEA